MSKLPKTKVTIFEYKTREKQATGTAEDIAKKFGIKEKSIFNHSKIIGYKYPEVKLVDLNTGEPFYGTADGVIKFTGLTKHRVNRILRHDNVSPNWKISYTGRYVEAQYKWSEKKESSQKPEDKHVQPVTPMSDYGKQLFEWSTRHLRRDA